MVLASVVDVTLTLPTKVPKNKHQWLFFVIAYSIYSDYEILLFKEKILPHPFAAHSVPYIVDVYLFVCNKVLAYYCILFFLDFFFFGAAASATSLFSSTGRFNVDF